ncbi:cytochrome c oxidase subunit II [Falsirhodobacter sp. 1013]|uniref:cytochrome c oxidase subunit II n=1 Tax=Falsirhodobacter sp. 1013 TaxID=3417566 RepID=UPI003EBB0BCD
MTRSLAELGRRLGALALLVAVAGCSGRQSALSPAGEDAAWLRDLWIVMLVGAVLLWTALNGMFYFVTRIRPRDWPERYANRLIIGGGVIFPTVLVGTLLAYGLSMMPHMRADGNGLVVKVRAEEWWWRVEYWPAGATAPIVTANEIRLPTGQRTELLLDANKYIHSFWIPALGGKMDMFPGRETRMTLRPETPGVYRGQCAEFCGPSHALMAFEAVILTPEDFTGWLEAEAAPALPPATPEAQRGEALFRDEGCGACHAVRGTDFEGLVGPDLTHLASRESLGAGIMEVTRDDLVNWIAHTGDIKPAVAMPAYDWLEGPQLADLAAYLEGLK